MLHSALFNIDLKYKGRELSSLKEECTRRIIARWKDVSCMAIKALNLWFKKAMGSDQSHHMTK